MNRKGELIFHDIDSIFIFSLILGPSERDWLVDIMDFTKGFEIKINNIPVGQLSHEN